MAQRPQRARRPAVELMVPTQVSAGPKLIYLELLENHRGPHIRITEVIRDQRNTIVVPPEMLPEIVSTLHAQQEFLAGRVTTGRVERIDPTAVVVTAHTPVPTVDKVPQSQWDATVDALALEPVNDETEASERRAAAFEAT